MPPSDSLPAHRTEAERDPDAPAGRPRGRPVVIASNRGPVSHDLDPSGEPVQRRGLGGLVTGLTGSVQSTGGLWVASTVTVRDSLVADPSPEGRIEVLTVGAKYQV